MPITTGGRTSYARSQGFYEKFPGREIAVKQLTLQPADRELQGPAHRQLRADPRRRSTRSSKACGPARRTPRQALDEAVKRGNELLREFEAANK